MSDNFVNRTLGITPENRRKAAEIERKKREAEQFTNPTPRQRVNQDQEVRDPGPVNNMTARFTNRTKQAATAPASGTVAPLTETSNTPTRVTPVSLGPVGLGEDVAFAGRDGNVTGTRGNLSGTGRVTLSNVQDAGFTGGTFSVSGVDPQQQADTTALVNRLNAQSENIEMSNLRRAAAHGDERAIATLAATDQAANRELLANQTANEVAAAADIRGKTVTAQGKVAQEQLKSQREAKKQKAANLKIENDRYQKLASETGAFGKSGQALKNAAQDLKARIMNEGEAINAKAGRKILSDQQVQNPDAAFLDTLAVNLNKAFGNRGFWDSLMTSDDELFESILMSALSRSFAPEVE